MLSGIQRVGPRLGVALEALGVRADEASAGAAVALEPADLLAQRGVGPRSVAALAAALAAAGVELAPAWQARLTGSSR